FRPCSLVSNSTPPSATDNFSNPVKLIAQDQQGTFWVAMREKGLLRWQEGKPPALFRHEPSNPYSLIDDDIRALAIDPAGKLWVGTFLGLNLYDPARGVFERYQHQAGQEKSLGSGSVRSIYFDTRGSAWIGTYYGGISYWNPDAFRFIHHQPDGTSNGLSHPVVSSFWGDQAGNVWIGTEGGGLNHWDRASDVYTHFPSLPTQKKGLSGNNVKVISGSGDSLWVGTFAGGLNLLHLKDQRWEHIDALGPATKRLSNNNVYDLLLEKEAVWIASFGGGLNRMDLKTGEISFVQHIIGQRKTLISNLVRVIIRDRSGYLWVGTNRGLDRLETIKNGEIRFQHFLEGMMISSILEASDGRLWIGTYQQGVIVLDENGKIIEQLQNLDGLPGRAAFGLLEDADQQIWVSSEHGLAKIDPAAYTLQAYNYSDGIANPEHNFNACYQTSSGEMFFGGTSGFTSFFPSRIRSNTFVPPLVFSAFTHLNQKQKPGSKGEPLLQSINETEELIFRYNQADFSLAFAALDYLNPANNQYAYKLEGLDQDWRFAKGATQVSYNLQKPGTYTFQLKAANSDGVWNPEERSIRVHVLPPPWRSNLAYAAYTLLLVLLLGGIIWFFRIRHRLQLEKLKKDQQEALHQAKLRFYTNITHELRTPLTLILGPVEELLAREADISENRKLKTIRHNAQRLMRLVNQLLSFRSLEQDQARMEAAAGNIVRFLKEVSLSFQEQARLGNVQFDFQAEEDAIRLWFDRDKLEKVFYNLLSNAFKFTPSGGEIVLSIAERQQHVEIRICDSGPGISVEARKLIFDRYYHQSPQNDATQKGSGIGLALSKQLIEMHKGQIQVGESTQGGACFQVDLPKGKEHYEPEELLHGFRDSESIDAYFLKAVHDENRQKESPLAPMKTLSHEEKQHLLIVEDNQAVRSYVCEIFTPFFQVTEASNGIEGMALAEKKYPDLIISDVMMPEMDGINMCRQIKSRVETSHIPIILLTARTGQIFRVQGVETGADAYLTKPFSPYELQLTVRNLLDLRRKTRARFETILKLEPREIAPTTSDERFLAKALDIVENQMGNTSFSVEQFARELAVSRPLLFTKMKSITGQTPNNFLKKIRLKRSAQLLQQGDDSVAQIAYQVGFSDPRYFSKCFQKEFGVNPKVYRTQAAEAS
ncbi:MAG: two-component regulator propeller domain-containing protein, partial [Bacteroidota bacterium]